MLLTLGVLENVMVRQVEREIRLHAALQRKQIIQLCASTLVVVETGMVSQVEREIRLHAALQHEHIIQLYGAFEDDRHVYLAQEFATGMS